MPPRELLPTLTFIDFGNADVIPDGLNLADKITSFCENAGLQKPAELLKIFPLAPGHNSAADRERFAERFRAKLRELKEQGQDQGSGADFVRGAIRSNVLGDGRTTDLDFQSYTTAFEVQIICFL